MDKAHEADVQGQLDALRVAVKALMHESGKVNEVRRALEMHIPLFPQASGPGFTFVSDILRGKRP